MFSKQQLTQFYGFIEHIRAEPENDDVKLIFSDWLSDNELLTWASLIRNQITMVTEGLFECINDKTTGGPRVFLCEKNKTFWSTNSRLCRFCKLSEEEQQCFWSLSLLNAGKVNSTNMPRDHEWSRGFIYFVKLDSLKDWEKLGPTLCDLHPVQGIICEELTIALYQPAIGNELLPKSFLPVYTQLLNTVTGSEDVKLNKLEKALLNWAIYRAQTARYIYVQDEQDE